MPNGQQSTSIDISREEVLQTGSLSGAQIRQSSALVHTSTTTFRVRINFTISPHNFRSISHVCKPQCKTINTQNNPCLAIGHTPRSFGPFLENWSGKSISVMIKQFSQHMRVPRRSTMGLPTFKIFSCLGHQFTLNALS
jgi:hypothetical protein